MILNQPKPSIDRICSKTTTGLAWIEPVGTVHWLNPRNTHGQWAYFYNRPHRDDGTWAPVEDMTTSNRLLEEGWIRVSNVLHVQVSSLEAVNPSAWDAWANLVAECKNSSNFSVESSIVGIASGRSGSIFDEMSVADAVDRLCSRRGKDAFWSSMMSESMVRRLIREMLLEDLAKFKEKTKDIDYMHSMSDPTFDDPYYKDRPYKAQAKDIKRTWTQEADHEFMKSIIKVHWLSGFNVGYALDDLLSLPRNNEIATMGYLPGAGRVTSSWGKAGVIVQGRVTLAANDMNAITSGYFKDVPQEVISKYKSSGTPRRSLMFNDLTSGEYVLDRETFKPEMSRHNEFIVDNWKPVGIVITYESQEFLNAVRKAPRPRKGDPPGPWLEYAGHVMKPGLPIYDEDMKLIDRGEIEKALRGEG